MANNLILDNNEISQKTQTKKLIYQKTLTKK